MNDANAPLRRAGRNVPWRTFAGIYLVLAGAYMAGASGHFYSTDHVSVYLTAQSIAEDGDLSIEPIHDTARGRDGAWFSVFGIGQSIVDIPLYLAGRALDDHAPADVGRYVAGEDIGDWGGTPSIFTVSLLNQLLAPLVAVVFFLLALEFGIQRRYALAATLILGLATSLAVGAHEAFQHPLETLCLLTALLVLFRRRGALHAADAAFAGALVAFGVLTRVNLAILVPALMVYVWALSAREPWNPRAALADRVAVVRLVAFGAPVAVSIALLLWLNWYRFGDALQFNPVASDQGFAFANLVEGVAGNLLSPGRGIFVYSPPLLLALWGARRFWGAHRAEALLIAVSTVATLLLYSSFEYWHGGWAWGPRYLLVTVPLLMLPAAYALEDRRTWVPAAILVLAGVAVQVLGTVLNVSYVTNAHWPEFVAIEDAGHIWSLSNSPIPVHARDLWRGDNIDLWLRYVQREFGTATMVATLAVPAAISLTGGALLFSGERRAEPDPEPSREPEPAAPPPQREPDTAAEAPKRVWRAPAAPDVAPPMLPTFARPSARPQDAGAGTEPIPEPAPIAEIETAPAESAAFDEPAAAMAAPPDVAPEPQPDTAADGERALTSWRDDARAPHPYDTRWRIGRLAVERELVVALAMLAAIVAFQLMFLWPEATSSAPMFNDGVLHTTMLRHVVDAMRDGRDPTDFWLAPISAGYALPHHYQHLAYFPPALVHLGSGEAVSQLTAYRWSVYLLLAAFPVSMFVSMRWFGFAPIIAALAAVVAPLLSTNGLYGFDDGSYVRFGYGLYTQLWGMVLLPMALARSYVAARDNRGYAIAAALIAATLLCHLVSGYIAIASLPLVVIAAAPRPRAMAWRALRLAFVIAVAGGAASYFLLWFAADAAYMNRSVWELASKYDGYGAEQTLRWLVEGELFDDGRLPAITAMAAAGALLCAVRAFRDERYRVPLLLMALWLPLYFGPKTWGGATDLLPFSSELHFHRLIAGVHLAGIMLAGVALAAPWRWALDKRRHAAWLLVPAAITAIILAPVFDERAAFLRTNRDFNDSGAAAYAREADDIDALVAALRAEAPARVYAGLGANWGSDYRVGDAPMYAILQGAGFDVTGYLYHALSLPSDTQVLFNEERAEWYELFDVRYIVAPEGRAVPPFAEFMQQFGRHRLYRVRTSGYFSLIASTSAYEGDREGVYAASAAWVRTPQFARGEHPRVYLDDAPDSARPLEDAPAEIAAAPADDVFLPARGAIVSVTVGDGAYDAVVRTESADALVMLKATYHPGWRATVDGRAVEPVMVLPGFMAVPVPAAGAHRVRFRYEAPAVRPWLALAGVLLLIVVAGGEVAVRRVIQRRGAEGAEGAEAV